MGNNDRDDKITLTGQVVESNKGIFKVMINENHVVNCRINGKLKVAEIKVISGDHVIIECSPYDLSVGRIVKRLKV